MKGGKTLEDALRIGSIALIDASWLVTFALQTKNGVLPCRQYLPKEAFLSIDEIIGSCTSEQGIQIIALSYLWLQPTHPDPKGETLRLLAKWCRSRLEESMFQCRQYNNSSDSEEDNDPQPSDCPRWAIFWDYASLYQHPDPSKGIYRTSEEEQCFQHGLDSLATLYSHTNTHCWKVTLFPNEYPDGYDDLPPGANCAEYSNRGWPFIESCWCSMTAPSSNTVDINRNNPGYYFTGGFRDDDLWDYTRSQNRLEPLTPEQVDEKIEDLVFTNARDDRPLLSRLYKEHFVSTLSQIRQLDYRESEWGDDQISQLATIIRSGYLPQLKEIDLGLNLFGVDGCMALSDALMSSGVGVPSDLRRMDLEGVQMGDAGVGILAKFLVHVQMVSLRGVNFQAEGCRYLLEAAMFGPNTKLRDLRLGHGSFRDEGVVILSPFIVQNLKNIDLALCFLGDTACKALADAAEVCCESPLTRIQLVANPEITTVGIHHLCRLVSNCHRLERLHLDEWLDLGTSVKEVYGPLLKSAAVSPNFQIVWERPRVGRPVRSAHYDEPLARTRPSTSTFAMNFNFKAGPV